MSPLSRPLTEIKPSYDVLIIGSGYGGAITASLLGRAQRADGKKPSVCVLERGREFQDGSFPRTLGRAVTELQLNAQGKQHGAQDALFWLHAGKQISVMHGCGLGGTSLINAGVALHPERRVFEEGFPRALAEDFDHGLAEGFAHAERMLRPVAYPTYPTGARLRKDAALLRTAEQLSARGETYAPPLGVSFATSPDGRNHVGVAQPACTGCGECVAGCNVGAKNTLTKNYLPDAVAHGVEIYCQVRVRRVESGTDGFTVHYQSIAHARDVFDGDDMFVRARVVVVAAGVLGSSEILLRSKQAGLRCSERIGRDISGNGDLLAFAYDGAEPVDAVGQGEQEGKGTAEHAPGPCITQVIDRRQGRSLSDAHVIQGGVIPGALAPLLPKAMRVAAAFADAEPGVSGTLRTALSSLVAAAELPSGARRALRNTQTLLVMSHDEGRGEVTLNDHEGDAEIAWPGTAAAGSGADARVAEALHDMLRAATEASGGTYVPGPIPTRDAQHQITVHPLGGCAMAEAAEQGVTNHKGQVFCGAAGDAVHAGLYVIDGSVVPRSLGVNPHLTIAALAERNARLLARDHGFLLAGLLADTAPSVASSTRRSLPVRASRRGDEVRLHFSEKMAGHCSTEARRELPYEAAEQAAKAAGSSCEFVVTVATDDCQKLIDDPWHAARIIGTVHMPALSRASMSIADGQFRLFIEDPQSHAQKHMSYQMQLQSVEGESFFLDGFKRLGAGGMTGLWRDTTTLFVDLYRGQDNSGEQAARGVLHITVGAFTKELLNMRASNESGQPSLRGLSLYGMHFASGLWDLYRPRFRS